MEIYVAIWIDFSQRYDDFMFEEFNGYKLIAFEVEDNTLHQG